MCIDLGTAPSGEKYVCFGKTQAPTLAFGKSEINSVL
jgi:hypothetical protein